MGRPPVRIVSGTLGTDELLLALVAPERIAALTRHVDDPRYSCASEAAGRVSRRVSGNAEEILAAAPDLVLVASYTRAAQVKLISLAQAPVYRFARFESFDDLRDNIRTLAKLCGVPERGANLVHELDRRLHSVHARIPIDRRRPRVLFVTRSLWTAGRGTTVHDILISAGGVNIAAQKGRTGWGRISPEELIAWAPEVVICQTPKSRTIRQHEWLGRQPGMAELFAVKRQRVWAVPARSMTSVSHHVATAVEDVHEVLYR